MRTAAALLALAALGAGLWHARPVLVWHLTVLPEIERLGRTDRVHLDTARELPRPGAGWTRLRVGTVTLHAPLRPGQALACRACARGCTLWLDEGKVSLIEGALPPWADALATYAPSANDVSIWKPVLDNWATVRALASRATLGKPPPEVFRYRTAATRGIVTRFESRGIERFVAYLFEADGEPLGIIGTSRVPLDTFRRILGSIAVGDTVGIASCAEDDGAWALNTTRTR